MIRYFLVSLAIGIVTETVAWKWRLWTYKKIMPPVFNLLFVFGLVFGSLAWTAHLLSREWPVPAALAAAGLAGVIAGTGYELLNDRLLNFWRFPSRGIGFLKTRASLVLGVGLSWGLLPPATWLIVEALQRWGY